MRIRAKFNEELAERLRPVIDWANENMPSPGRTRLTFGRGNSIVLFFADNTSKGLQEQVKEKDSDDSQRTTELLTKLFHKQIPLTEEEERWLQSQPEKEKSSIEMVFSCLACVGQTCEKLFHDPERLKQFMKGIMAVAMAVTDDEREGR